MGTSRVTPSPTLTPNSLPRLTPIAFRVQPPKSFRPLSFKHLNISALSWVNLHHFGAFFPLFYDDRPPPYSTAYTPLGPAVCTNPRAMGPMFTPYSLATSEISFYDGRCYTPVPLNRTHPTFLTPCWNPLGSGFTYHQAIISCTPQLD